MNRGDKVSWTEKKTHSMEWYTPVYVFEPLLGGYYKVVRVNGSFDDSCSGEKIVVHESNLTKLEK